MGKKCKYCAGGNVADESGNHWIVKSIIPAKIMIKKCTEAKAEKHHEQHSSPTDIPINARSV